MYLDAQSNHQNHIDLKMENVDLFTPHILDMDIEKGKLEIPKSNDETIGNLKTEDPLTHWQRTLQRQLSLQIKGKFMHLLMTDNLVLPKFISRDKSGTERVHDMPNNRSRKYKRSASFNSRKVVLLFSVLSSMGTIILIYLTLRARQMGDGYAHV
ncbi:unnamed protein product [Ilex paraguariensis]|uniref:Uncharacterized protein n=1 Tax=Ilex paraguariensis TaxID=185542 RepID=A0ABC8S1Q6_9AQUA